jgi:tetratricopeptide (TPR) repeat protein
VPLRACHNQPVLPDDLFGPLDLDEALDHAEDAGEDAVIALLREALTDPRAHGDEQLADYLDPLVEAYRSAGRQREAIDTLRQIADREPNLRGYLTALIADLHAQLGEQDTALNLIKTWQATQRALAADQRDIDFYAPTALTAAEQAGDLELARSLIADGLRLAAERGDAPVQELMLTAVEMRLFPRRLPRPGTPWPVVVPIPRPGATGPPRNIGRSRRSAGRRTCQRRSTPRHGSRSCWTPPPTARTRTTAASWNRHCGPSRLSDQSAGRGIRRACSCGHGAPNRRPQLPSSTMRLLGAHQRPRLRRTRPEWPGNAARPEAGSPRGDPRRSSLPHGGLWKAITRTGSNCRSAHTVPGRPAGRRARRVRR